MSTYTTVACRFTAFVRWTRCVVNLAFLSLLGGEACKNLHRRWSAGRVIFAECFNLLAGFSDYFPTISNYFLAILFCFCSLTISSTLTELFRILIHVKKKLQSWKSSSPIRGAHVNVCSFFQYFVPIYSMYTRFPFGMLVT